MTVLDSDRLPTTICCSSYQEIRSYQPKFNDPRNSMSSSSDSHILLFQHTNSSYLLYQESYNNSNYSYTSSRIVNDVEKKDSEEDIKAITKEEYKQLLKMMEQKYNNDAVTDNDHEYKEPPQKDVNYGVNEDMAELNK